MACLDFIAETASEKPLSMSLYKFVIKTQQIWIWCQSVLIWHQIAGFLKEVASIQATWVLFTVFQAGPIQSSEY